MHCKKPGALQNSLRESKIRKDKLWCRENIHLYIIDNIQITYTKVVYNRVKAFIPGFSSCFQD